MHEYLKKPLSFFLPFLLILIIFPISSCQNVKSNIQVSKVENGVIDLRNWDFEKNGPVNLKGQWEFYWKKHITSKEFKDTNPDFKTEYIYAPGIWNNFLKNGKKYPARDLQPTALEFFQAITTGSFHLSFLIWPLHFVSMSMKTLLSKMERLAKQLNKALLFMHPGLYRLKTPQNHLTLLSRYQISITGRGGCGNPFYWEILPS